MSVVVPPSSHPVRSRAHNVLSSSHRPLPDERPRQSVANLIGRFEQQGKRQASPAVPVVPRSSSISSQIAGDAAKEEVKEKREWPPKPMASTDIKPLASTLSNSPSPTISKSTVVSPQPIPDPAPPVDIPTTSDSCITGARKVSSIQSETCDDREVNTYNGSAAGSSVSRKISLLDRQQLLCQVSRQLSSEDVSPVVCFATSQAPTYWPSSATQHQVVARPKTPSSGLFAPTAASLARSRNAPPPPPPPVKKATLSSDAAERLSKPTAASLSKARTPALPAASPAGVAKSTSTGAHGSTPRLRRTPVKPKEAIDTNEGIAPGPVSVSSVPSRDSDHLAADHVENGHESGTTAFSDAGSPEDTHGHLEVVGDAAHDPTEDEDVRSDPGVHPAEEEAHNHEHVADNHPEEEATREHEQVRLEVHEDTVVGPAEPHAGGVLGNGNSLKVEHAATGNDIEDIVNLLEGASLSKPRPQSIVSIPDEDGEIADEY
ncbi:hypothetical protein J3R82DRAFT_11680 [Butyriboletus roseoflavus]|nr:hypothetical protein J3R82DRAFT_11680 [Butyriboletus roseoflavus]